MIVETDRAALLLAQQDGVLSAAEAIALDALADSDEGRVPEHLMDAVERLFLWCMDSGETVH
jgi:hypothetical protein